MVMATQASLFTPTTLSNPKSPWKQSSLISFTTPKPLKSTATPLRTAIKATAAAEGKTEAPVGFTPPELDPNTPSPIFGGSTGGLLRKAQVEEFYVITWTSPKEQIFEMPTGGAAIMREGPNLLKLARKEQCLAREEKDDITKKGDMSDFYFNLSKNVAFGAGEAELRKKHEKRQEEERIPTSERSHPSTGMHLDSSSRQQGHQSEMSAPPKESSESVEAIPVSESSTQEKVATEPVTEQPRGDHHHKRNIDALAAAKERYMARKRTKEE